MSFDLYLTGTAFPLNTPPQVTAGPDQTVAFPGDAMLDGSSSDDGLPIPPGQLALTWSQVSGPGGITFANRNTARTRASFTTSGNYLLRLAATDGALTVYDETGVTVTGNAYEQWKAQHFTPAELNDPAISGDNADPDLDGHTNQQEYVTGTDPRDPNSVLRILRASWDTASPPRLWIHFPVVQGHSYTVQYRAVPFHSHLDDPTKSPLLVD